LHIFKETKNSLQDGGYRYVGYITHDANGKSNMQKMIPRLGSADELENIIDSQKIKLVVLALEKSEQASLENLISRLSEKDVEIKIQPNTLDILSGSVKTINVMGAALIDLQTGLMPEWQQNIKKIIDIVTALLGLILLSPLILFAAIRVWLSSKGPVFFVQERIGYKGDRFVCLNFAQWLMMLKQMDLPFHQIMIHVLPAGEK
jgi:hypothetical protein